MRILRSATALWLGIWVAAAHAEPMVSAPAPEWVRTIEFDHDAESMSGENGIRQLLVDRQMRFATNGQIETFFRFAAMPTTRRGVRSAAQLTLDFNPEYETLIWHRIDVHRDGQTTDRLQLDTIELLHRELGMEWNIVDGRRSAHTVLPDIRVNDVIEWSFTIRGRNPVLGDGVFGSARLGWDSPVHKLYLRLLVPRNLEVNVRLIAGAAEPRRRRQGDYREFSWTLEDVERVQSIEGMPAWQMIYPEVSFSEFAEWSRVVDWALPLYAEKGLGSRELEARVDAIRNENPDAESRIIAALEWVQDEIRYYGIELGENSHLPRPPATTFKQRFGDCKDKVVLLRSMLSAMGIESHPTLVSTTLERSVAELTPSPAAFDHVILRIVHNGQSYWVDPTESSERGSLDHRFADFGMALPIASQTTGLESMEPPAEWSNRVTTRERIETHPDDLLAAELDVVYVMNNDYADVLRSTLLTDGNDLMQESFESHYGQVYGEAYANGDLIRHDEHTRNEITLNTGFELPALWEPVEGFRRVETYARSLADYLPLPERLDTKASLAVEYPMIVEHVITVRDPRGIVMNKNDANLLLEDQFVRYSRKVESSENEIIIQHLLTTLADEVTAPELRAHSALRREIRESLSVVVVAMSHEREQLKEREKRIKNSLRRLLGESE